MARTALGPALVTGASGGIGDATARRLAAAGRDVALHAFSHVAAAEETASEIRAGGVRALVLQADLTRRDEAVALVERALAELGDLEVMVGNAGIDVLRPTSVLDYGDDLWDRMLAIHLSAPFVMARAVIPHFIKRGGGVVVNVASIAGQVAWPGNIGYNAAKAGLINMTRTIATEYAKSGIRANCVCPGMVQTPMLDGIFDQQPDPAATRASATTFAPAGRLGEPRDIADAFVYLASDEASFVTGVALPVDGGLGAGKELNL